jgi:TnpA family transposase
MTIQLQKHEHRHRLARDTFHGQRGRLRQRYRQGQEDQLSALGLVLNAIVLWSTSYNYRLFVRGKGGRKCEVRWRWRCSTTTVERRRAA